jgi:hypothetical protein
VFSDSGMLNSNLCRSVRRESTAQKERERFRSRPRSCPAPALPFMTMSARVHNASVASIMPILACRMCRIMVCVLIARTLRALCATISTVPYLFLQRYWTTLDIQIAVPSMDQIILIFETVGAEIHGDILQSVLRPQVEVDDS